jgi:hypothetical protein
LKVFWLNQKFVPTLPEWRSTRIQMDVCPLACAQFSWLANVVFIFDDEEKTPFQLVCQMDCAVKIALSDSGAVLDWFKA